MGHPGAGPRWQAGARRESAIRHWETAPSRATPEEKRGSLALRAKETEQRRALFSAETDAETT